MSSSSSLTFFTLSSFLLILFQTVNTTNIINDTCNKSANPNLDYNFCVTSLQADPNSDNADIQKLCNVSITLTLSNMTYVESKIQMLLNDEQGDPEVLSNLHNRLKLYRDAIHYVNDAMKKFNSKDYGGANEKLGAANEAALDCEVGFKIKGVASPMSKENDNCFQLTAIGQAITNIIG